MINKIGLGCNLGVQRIVFRGEENDANKELKSNGPVTNFPPENIGLDALAAYNSAIVKKNTISKDSFDIEPLVPIRINPDDVEKMEGERIYSSDGKLHSIVRRDENVVTVFTPFADNDKMFALIEKFDKKSGRGLIFSQKNYIEDGQYKEEFITEYNPRTGMDTRSTSYADDKLDFVSKTVIDKNGKEHRTCFYYDDRTYSVSTSFPNGNRELLAYFDENKQLIDFHDYKSGKGYSMSTGVEFYHGAPVRISVTKDMIMPNTIGWENFMNLEELKPSVRSEKIENIKDIEGERTYYSNGALESNKFNSDEGETTAYFRPEGSCERIQSNKKDIKYNNNYEVIEEILDDGSVKETTFFKKGFVKVKLSDGKTYKEIEYSDKNKPNYYSEGIITDEGEKETKWLSFDKNGMLECGRDYVL